MLKWDEGHRKFSYFEDTESDSVLQSLGCHPDSHVVVQKGQKVPPWFDRAVKYLDYGSFSDNSYEMPGGVLSYICHVHTKLLRLLALKTELPIKYSTVHMGGEHSSLPAWLLLLLPLLLLLLLLLVFRKKVGWVCHHMHESNTCVTCKHWNKQAIWYTGHTELMLSCDWLHFFSRISLFDTFYIVSSMNSRGVEQHKGCNCSCLNTSKSPPRRPWQLLLPTWWSRREKIT